MPPHSSAGSDLDQLLRQACAELQRRLRAGHPCHAETFLDAFPTLASDPQRALDLVVTEFQVRHELGQRPDPQEWLRRFPQWREGLRRQFRILNVLTDLGSDAETAEAGTEPHLDEQQKTVVDHPTPELGRHELFEVIGGGSMGVVYRARDTVLDREVALKVIRSGVLACREEVDRFYREARAAGRLRHPNVVPIHGMGLHQGQHCFTMPLLRGGSLATHLKRFQQDARAAVALVEKTARAVQAAHDQKIVHRDLKPGNILLDENGEPHVADFGLAKVPEASAEMTTPGRVLGTPAYMAPEQAAGQNSRVGPASDVWALGVILYELLVGQRPFTGDDSEGLLRRVQTDDVPRPRALRPSLPRDLETVLLKCLEKEPPHRYASAGELADELGRWLGGEPVQTRRQSRVGRVWRRLRRPLPIGLTAACLLGLAAFGLLGGRRQPADDELAAVQRRLASGEEVTLIGPDGLPPWRPTRFGVGGLSVLPDEPGAFVLNAWQHDLVEVLPALRAGGYRYSARVRQESSHLGEAGLSLLYGEQKTGRGTERFFATLTFADKGRAAGRVQLDLRRYRDPDLKQRSRLLSKRLPPAPDTWRQLVVQVGPGTVAAWCDGLALGEVGPAPLRASAEYLMKAEPAPGIVPAFPATGGLGLFAFECSASFRDVTVRTFP